MQIAAKSAVVKTAQVEVKALSISGKQVTLAVFRQLDQRDLIDHKERQLNGMPWGRINYHPDKCGDDRAHLHVIWQKGEYLYRDGIFRDFTGDYFDGMHDVWSLRRESRDVLRGVLIDRVLTNGYPQSLYGEEAIDVEGFPYVIRLSEPIDQMLARWVNVEIHIKERGSDGFAEDRILEHAKYRETLQGHIRSVDDLTEVNARFSKALAESKLSKQYHTEIYRQLSELDLLFIAV